MDIRKIVERRMRELDGMTAYALAKRLKGIVPKGTICDWIDGRTKTINSEALGHICDAVRLDLKPK